ncbi:hypothetical protein BVE84_03185 [Streptococcus azizii]|uniref:DUF4298 domain-containing protein n=2 Tax=Streptococcus TaxID=1301 RepID=A0AB36JRH4_9STRE|nr:hypothetical protein BVE86_02465 [Streptococcus azizii]ONK29271.1 hypothetical protein BVE85_03190 [Streptococcus azizii]ONK30261.1 hypothetical protein BVE84_03185 [Streptococcus azizii]TFU84209.1 DUF4298 domain-containing protein [Streptococcus sp. AN2]
MNDVKKIQKMEEILNRAETVFMALEESLEEFEQLLPSLMTLFAYYESDEWMRHYRMDEEGQFPQNLARGVLSQDAVYHLMMDYYEVQRTMQELGKARRNT